MLNHNGLIGIVEKIAKITKNCQNAVNYDSCHESVVTSVRLKPNNANQS